MFEDINQSWKTLYSYTYTIDKVGAHVNNYLVWGVGLDGDKSFNIHLGLLTF